MLLMSITFQCANSECGKRLSVPDGSGGKKARCQYCNTVQIVPAQSAPPPPAAPAAPLGGMNAFGSSAFGSPGGKAPKSPKTKASKASGTRGGASMDSGLPKKIIAAVVVLGLLAGLVVVIMKTIKTGGEVAEKHIDTVFETKHIAERQVSQNNLVLIRDALKQYMVTEDKYPADLDELVKKQLVVPDALKPAPDAEPYKYIPGQRDDMPAENVLVYEASPTREIVNVLFRDGTIKAMSPDAAKTAASKTHRYLQGSGVRDARDPTGNIAPMGGGLE